MFPMCPPPASGQVCGSKKVKLLNFENDTIKVMRNLFAAKAAVRIIQAKEPEHTKFTDTNIRIHNFY